MTPSAFVFLEAGSYALFTTMIPSHQKHVAREPIVLRCPFGPPFALILCQLSSLVANRLARGISRWSQYSYSQLRKTAYAEMGSAPFQAFGAGSCLDIAASPTELRGASTYAEVNGCGRHFTIVRRRSRNCPACLFCLCAALVHVPPLTLASLLSVTFRNAFGSFVCRLCGSPD